ATEPDNALVRAGTGKNNFPLISKLSGMRYPRVVKPGTALHFETKVAVDARYSSNKLLSFKQFFHWHEIGGFPHAIGREKPGQQDICIRQVHLFILDIAVLRADLEIASFIAIEKGGEYAGRIKLR